MGRWGAVNDARSKLVAQASVFVPSQGVEEGISLGWKTNHYQSLRAWWYRSYVKSVPNSNRSNGKENVRKKRNYLFCTAYYHHVTSTIPAAVLL